MRLLEPGDRILMVSDGLPEAPAAGAPIGYEAFEQLLNDTTAPDASGWVDALFDNVKRATSPVLEDDWTALLLERR